MESIAKAFQDGGGFMYAIAAVSVFGIGIIIERFIFLFFRYNINATAFMAQIQKLVMAGNIERAIRLCNAAPSAALPRVVKAGLTRANKGEVEIQNAVEEATLEVVPAIQKRTNSLQAIANMRQRPIQDYVHGVIQVSLLGEMAKADALDAFRCVVFEFH